MSANHEDMRAADRIVMRCSREIQRYGINAISRILLASPMILVLAIVLVGFLLLADNFATYSNFLNIGRLFAPLLIAAIGLSFVFLIGGIDLSVGSTISLSSVFCAMVMAHSGFIALGVAAGIGTGLCIGLINGIAISYARFPAFVYTLAMLLTIRAVALLCTGGYSVGGLPIGVMSLGRQTFLGVPSLLGIALVVFAAAQFALSFTSFGRQLYLVGTSERAATFNGLPVKRVRCMAYVTCGGLAGLAGVIVVLRLGSGGPVVGDNLLLMACAAVVLGGTSILGGDGSVAKTLVGAALIIFLDKGLDMLGFSFYDQAIVMGAIVIVGSAFSTWLHGRLSRV
ncbi:ABC transporter permease [Mesorhizobium sp. CO1-1-8]|uniref:ABC transporter permease n=1 Tax=Mesorhizobium sp. CO1-1-8 TaxID=2876631 RepID=UPI001CD14825|nr:ABC transporter permease [Mesorhizobium sp. CO1-1-8]MBZ9772409.1 ABC transporter permease [Mesorhizobium sp. CO1-1-8]